MNPLALFFYSASLRMYKAGAAVKSLWNKKAKQWINGQENSLPVLKNFPRKKNKRIWFHCASVGEFEQARPLIERIKKETPLAEIVLTFFSPSGFELRKNYPFAHSVLYLPLDSKFSSTYFLEHVNPDAAVFVKYELWYFYLESLRNKNIPAYLVSAIFQKDHWLNTWYGKSFRPMLQSFKVIFVQNESSKKLAEQLGCHNVIVSGDTRVDRVLTGKMENKRIPEIESWIGGKKLFLAGSTWPEDEELIVKFIREESPGYPGWKWMIVPHEISEAHLQHLKNDFGDDGLLYSGLHADDKKANILIFDKVGKLAYLYRYAQVTYVGGGFGKGIHNILEAVVYGAPAIIGPNYRKFNEAEELIRLGAAFSITDYASFKDRMNGLLNDAVLRERTKQITTEYFSQKKGATEKVYAELKKEID